MEPSALMRVRPSQPRCRSFSCLVASGLRRVAVADETLHRRLLGREVFAVHCVEFGLQILFVPRERVAPEERVTSDISGRLRSIRGMHARRAARTYNLNRRLFFEPPIV
jgi:hypothetical protein